MSVKLKNLFMKAVVFFHSLGVFKNINTFSRLGLPRANSIAFFHKSFKYCTEKPQDEVKKLQEQPTNSLQYGDHVVLLDTKRETKHLGTE